MSLSLVLCGDEHLQDEVELVLSDSLHVITHVPVSEAMVHHFFNTDLVIFLCTEENYSDIQRIYSDLKNHPEFELKPVVAYFHEFGAGMESLFDNISFDLIYNAKAMDGPKFFSPMIHALYQKMHTLQKLQNQEQQFIISNSEQTDSSFNGQFHILANKKLSTRLSQSLPEDNIKINYTEPETLQRQLERLTEAIVVIDLGLGKEAVQFASSLQSHYNEAACLILIPEDQCNDYLKICVYMGFFNILIYDKQWKFLKYHISHLTKWKSRCHQYQQNIHKQLSISVYDDLTGLCNRRYLDQHLSHRLKKFTPTAIMLVDIDHFKQVNDQYGHLVGDEALKVVSTIITQQFRRNDVLGRWGGEEFVVIIDHKSDEITFDLAERLREAIVAKAHPILANGQHHIIPLSISIGISVSEDSDVPAGLIERADKALYSAKEKGRNRTEVGTK